MTIQSDYGTVEYEENDLLVFRDGIFGFPKLTRYLLLRMNDDDDSILLMLSVEDTSVAFVLFDPFALCPDYSPVLTPEELSCLGAKDSEELSYYVICVVQTDYMENTVNLKCPLVINPETRHGSRSSWPIPTTSTVISYVLFHRSLTRQAFQIQNRKWLNADS